MVRLKTYGNPQLRQSCTEPLDFTLHLLPALVPEILLLRFLERYSCGFLQGTDAREAYPCVRCRDVFDKIVRSEQPANTPPGAVEIFACGADCKGARGQSWREGCDAGEGCIVETVVDLVREDNDVMLFAEVADGYEFFFRKDFANWVVPMPIRLLSDRNLQNIR